MGRQLAQAIEQPATFFGLILEPITRLDVMITELKFKILFNLLSLLKNQYHFLWQNVTSIHLM